MWVRLTICLVIAGCGYPALPKIGGGSDGHTSDATTDGAGGGSGDGSSGAIDCLQRWIDSGLDLAFSTPQELITTPVGTDDRDPWISADGLRMYFARNPGSKGKTTSISRVDPPPRMPSPRR